MSPLNRRQFMSASALAALGVSLQHSALSGLVAAPKPRLGSAPAPAPGYAAVAPFTLTSHSNLSEDYFSTTTVTIDPTTEAAIPIIRSDGSQSILVIEQVQGAQASQLSLVAPDPTSPTGFVNGPVGDLAGTISTQVPIAVAAGPNNTVQLLYFDTDARPLTASIAADGTVSAGAPFTTANSWAVSAPRMACDASGQSRCALFDPQGDGVPPTVYLGAAGSPAVARPVEGFTSDLQVTDVQFTVVGSTSAPDLLAVTSSQSSANAPELGLAYGAVNGTAPLQFTPVDLPAAFAINDATLPAPPLPAPIPAKPQAVAAVLWIDSGNANVVTCDAQGNAVTAPVRLLSPRFGLSAGQVSAANWFQDPATHLIYVFVLAGDVLYKQTLDLTASVQDMAPIPLQTGVSVLGLPTRGLTGDSALVLGSPSTEVPGQVALTTLSRRANLQRIQPAGQLPSDSQGGAWVSAPINATPPGGGTVPYIEVDTYRTMLTVTDAVGAPVAGTNVYITPEVDVLAFRTTGGVVLPAGTESTVATDDWGQVCLATPATALQQSPMSVRCDLGPATGSSAVLRTAPVIVNPDGEVHAYLAGTAPLNAYPDVSHLLAQPAFAKINSTPTYVTAVAGAINAAVTAGMQPTTPPGTKGGPIAFTLSGLDTGQPVLSTNTAVVRSQLGAPSWWGDFSHDLESVWKAVERGVAKVASVAHGWDAAAHQWFVNLAIDIKGYVVATLNYAITDLRSAIVAVHGIFQAIGADIASVISLIRTLVTDLMKDTVAIGDTLYSWINYAPKSPGSSGLAVARNTVDDLLNDAKNATNGFFGRAEADLTAAIQQLNTTAPRYTPSASKAAGTSSIPPSQSTVANPSHNSRSTWLLEKTRSAPLPASMNPGGSVSAGTAGIATSVGSQVAPTASASSAAAKLPSAKDLLENLSMTTVTELVLEVLADGLGFLDDVIIDILNAMEGAIDDLCAAISMPLENMPVIGELLTLFNIDIGDLSIGKLICYVLGFGMAVVGDVVYGGNGWLPSPVGSAVPARSHALSVRPGLRAADTTPSWETYIKLGSIVTDAFSVLPTVAVAQVVANDPLGEPPVPLQIIELVFGVVENALYFPFGSPPDSGTVLSWDAKQTDANKFFGAATPIYSWTLGFLPAIVQILAANLSAKNADHEDNPFSPYSPALSEEEESFMNKEQLILLSAIGFVNLGIDIAVTALSETGVKNILIDVLVDVFAWLPTALTFCLLAPEGSPPVIAWIVLAIASPVVLIGCEIAELALD